MISKVFVILAVVAAANAGGLVGVGAPVLGAGHLGLVSAQSTAINHVAPAASLGYAGPLAYRHGLAAAPLAYGHGLATAPLAYGLGPARLGLGHGLAAAPLGYGLGHGLASGNLRADGVVGNGILGSRYGGAIVHNAVVGHGLLGGAYHGGILGLGHGAGLGKAFL